jgi:hypothetical protein
MGSDAEVHARFEAHVGPVRDALMGLLDTAEKLRQSWGSMPDANSRAMAELALEHQFKSPPPWGDDPVQSAHNLGQLLLYGASDCARGVVRLLSSDETPVFAHVVLARGGLEHAGRAWTLVDPSISVRLRVARVMNERLFGLSAQLRLPVDEADKQRARERRAALLAAGEQLGYRKVRPDRQTPVTLETQRMSQTALVRAILQTSEDATLGATVYGYYSAVAHGTTFGLTQSVEMNVPGAPATPGVTWGGILTSSRAVVTVLVSLILGLGPAYKARNDFFGWPSQEWNQAYAHALRSARQGLPE